ncbi:MAG: tRNA pseudouridine(38-40) synthase TruA [Oscillospiraceae bacterium]|jgi:tRNA pseudouridine38-40 synthase|nr:tRNA pseudouridine(38-40) synthase TruA [Oscillospiraceae bacterium]
MRNVALRLRFDGARYHGWQLQKTEVTVSGTLEKALSRVCGEEIRTVGCSRTDAGVHANRYCASFRTASAIPAERLPPAVNTLLPPDVAVVAAADAPEDFNAILSCVKKEYIYKIMVSRIRDPFWTGRAYFYPRALDTGAMREAAGHFVGTRDFAAVRSVGTETKTTVRTVHWFEVEPCEKAVILRVCADGFLYNMARAMAGTLLYVSEGKIAPGELPGLLETRDRRRMGPTVPPWGLYLNRVWYGGEVGRMMESDF